MKLEIKIIADGEDEAALVFATLRPLFDASTVAPLATEVRGAAPEVATAREVPGVKRNRRNGKTAEEVSHAATEAKAEEKPDLLAAYNAVAEAQGAEKIENPVANYVEKARAAYDAAAAAGTLNDPVEDTMKAVEGPDVSTMTHEEKRKALIQGLREGGPNAMKAIGLTKEEIAKLGGMITWSEETVDKYYRALLEHQKGA